MSIGRQDDGTRTRLPEGEGGQDKPSNGRSLGRKMLPVGGVVVLLLAVIVVANQGPSSESEEGTSSAKGPDDAGSQPTAPSGATPPQPQSDVGGEFPRSEQGAQSAATNYAAALGGDGMFQTKSRHQIIDTVYTPAAAGKLKSAQDKAYTPKLLARMGLDKNGQPPKGSTFVNRTIPVGSELKSGSGSKATVAVWCNGLSGIAGEGSKRPVTTNWFTLTLDLQWTDGAWKVTKSSQAAGPTPVEGENPISGPDEISDAVKKFGGYTYAR